MCGGSTVHGEGSVDHEVIRRCRAPIASVSCRIKVSDVLRMHELTKHHTNQPEREFLEDGENREIRKIRNNEQKCQKLEFSQRSHQKKRKLTKQKSRTKQAKANPEQTPSKTLAIYPQMTVPNHTREAPVIWGE